MVRRRKKAQHIFSTLEWASCCAFRQKVPKLWTSVVHSILQQIAQNKNWAHPKATSNLTRIYKVETQHASLLYLSAKPQSGDILGYSIPDVLSKLAERSERTQSTLRGHAAVVVTRFRALIMITSVDRHRRAASICLIFSTPQIAATAFVFNETQNDYRCDRPFMAKNNLLPLLMIQSRQNTHWPQKLKLRPY